jgi:hypothetical protein
MLPLAAHPLPLCAAWLCAAAAHIGSAPLTAAAPLELELELEPLLAAALADPRWPLRDAGVECLQRLHACGAAVPAHLLAAVWALVAQDPCPDVRATAAELSAAAWPALGAQQHVRETVLGAVAGLLQDSEDPARRAGVALAFAAAASADTTPEPLAAALCAAVARMRDDGDWEVCLAVQRCVAAGDGPVPPPPPRTQLCAALCGGTALLLRHLAAPDRLTRLGFVFCFALVGCTMQWRSRVLLYFHMARADSARRWRWRIARLQSCVESMLPRTWPPTRRLAPCTRRAAGSSSWTPTAQTATEQQRCIYSSFFIIYCYTPATRGYRLAAGRTCVRSSAPVARGAFEISEAVGCFN